MIAYTLETALAHPEQVRSLVLYRQNLMSWPDALFHLPQLQHLELDQCQIDHLDERLADLPLRALLLPNNRLTSIPAWLSDLTQLESLDLSHNTLTTWPEQASPPQLRSLRLAHNRLRRLPVRLILPLTHLDLRRNPLSSQDWPQELLPLESIRLEGSPKAARQFIHGHHPKLTELTVNRCKLERLPDVWTDRYPQLRHLDLSNNAIRTIPPDLPEASPLLRIVQLSRNSLTELPGRWPSDIHIMDMDLSGNQLTDLPASLDHLNWLIRLNLAGNPLTAIPEQVAQLPRLESLNLRKTELVDLPTGPWPALTRLQIHHTPLATHEAVLRGLPQRIRVSGKKKHNRPSSTSLARFRQMADKNRWDVNRQTRLWEFAQDDAPSRATWSIQDHLDLWKLGRPGYPAQLVRLATQRPSGTWRNLAIFGRSWLPQTLLAERAASSGITLVQPSTAQDADLVLLGSPRGNASVLDPDRQAWVSERELLTNLPPQVPAQKLTDHEQVMTLLSSPLPIHRIMGQQLLAEQGIPHVLYGELLLIIRQKRIPHLQKSWPALLIRFGQGDWVADCLAPLNTLDTDIFTLARKWGAKNHS